MKISVVVPTFGKRELLRRTLASLAAQEGTPPFEAIVVEDGADPGMGVYARSLGMPFPLETIVHETTRGRSATRNSGIARAGGDVVLFLDGDMEVVPPFLAAHAAAHESLRRRPGGHPGGAGDRAVVLGNIVTSPEIARTPFVEYIDSRGVHKLRPGEESPPRYFMTGNSSVAAALLRRAGGFDEEFDEYGGEDTEMGYRLGAAGGVFAYAPEAVSHHLDLNSVPRMAERLARYGERMLPILVRKAPAARGELRLELAEPRRADDSARLRAAKLAAALVCRPAVWRTAAALGGALPRGRRADALFDFVRAAAYLDGYRRALRARGAASGGGAPRDDAPGRAGGRTP